MITIATISHRFFCSQEQSLSVFLFWAGLMFSLNVSAIGLTLFTLSCEPEFMSVVCIWAFVEYGSGML